MHLTATSIAGVVIIDLEPHTDERGSFARAFDRDVFAAAGLMTTVVDVNITTNPSIHTLRGMHFQAEPEPDPKVVRCVRGAVFDVAIDLRPGSATHGRWVGHTLDAEGRSALHIPAGCAHGYLTLTTDTELHYLMGAPYRPELARGVRWDDPRFAVEWPAQPQVISARDSAYEDHQP